MQWAGGLGSVARHPFWRDERGLHVLWDETEGGTGTHAHLLVVTFDPTTGDVVQSRVYDPFPLELNGVFANAVDAAGAPDGRFAAVISYASDVVHPEGSGVYRVVFGHLDDPDQFFIWTPPWSTDEKSVIHVGWDGEAFAVHAVDQLSPWYVVTRLDWNGKIVSEVLPPTQIGTMGDISPGSTEMTTDPETGITWVGTTSHPGVWMSGHYRDGKLLPGVGPMGGGAVGYPGGDGYASQMALAAFGKTAFVAWTEYQAYAPAYAVGTDESFLSTDPSFSLLPDPKDATKTLDEKTVARYGAGWALIAKDLWHTDLFLLNDDGSQSRRRLVTYREDEDCLKNVCSGLDLRVFSSVAYGDELWFGFWDQSDALIDGHARNSYRIVRVKDGCTYKSMFDIRSGK
jgi:hypothetical protein